MYFNFLLISHLLMSTCMCARHCFWHWGFISKQSKSLAILWDEMDKIKIPCQGMICTIKRYSTMTDSASLNTWSWRFSWGSNIWTEIWMMNKTQGKCIPGKESHHCPEGAWCTPSPARRLLAWSAWWWGRVVKGDGK